MKVLEKKVGEMMQRKSINLKMHLRNNKKQNREEQKVTKQEKETQIYKVCVAKWTYLILYKIK